MPAVTEDPIELLKQFAYFNEVYEKTEFWCVRRRKKDGAAQAVKVTIFDAGPTTARRFHLSAKSNDGKSLAGHPQATINEAMAAVNWHELDK